MRVGLREAFQPVCSAPHFAARCKPAFAGSTLAALYGWLNRSAIPEEAKS
jgi:hypothetical protein